ncbi:SNF2 family N-terminal domain-containing protein [Gongronella butleri]|nr:SNF2 family N-terminal domain-containing protein [Gongronella butleri]
MVDGSQKLSAIDQLLARSRAEKARKARVSAADDDDSNDVVLIDAASFEQSTKKRKASAEDLPSSSSSPKRQAPLPKVQVEPVQSSRTETPSTTPASSGSADVARSTPTTATIAKRNHPASLTSSRSNSPMTPMTPDSQTNVSNTHLIQVNARCRRLRKPVYLHPSIATRLKEHQVDGLEFMWKRLIEDESGCILAHHMGLGKTIMVIALITTIFYEIDKGNPEIPVDLQPRRFLILAPLITMSNWMNEFDAWIPSDCISNLSHIYCAANFQGMSDNKRIRVLETWYNTGGIMLMNYDMFRSMLAPARVRLATYEQLLLSPSMIILDESHRIKNNASQITRTLNRVQTPRRLCLTGYPLQNNMIEFYTMIHFTFPELVGDLASFKQHYQQPIENVFANSEPAVRRLATAKLLELQLLTNWVIQRRDAKILHNELPGISEFFITCRLTPLQLKLYAQFLSEAKTSCNNILVNLTVMRAICTHPAVLDKVLTKRHGDIEQYKTSTRVLGKQSSRVASSASDPNDLDDNDLEGLELDEYESIAANITASRAWASKILDDVDHLQRSIHSFKMATILSICQLASAREEKVVVVSHSIATLDYLRVSFFMQGIVNLRIDGTTPQLERQSILDRFNTEASVKILFLSSRAGGIGVNITGANRMILVDVDWNPSYDQQAIGRIYRFGQTKRVFVYRMMTHTTVEPILMAKNIHKLGLSSRVIDNELISSQHKRDMVMYYQEPKEPTPCQYTESAISQFDDPIMREIMRQDRNGIQSVQTGADVVRSAAAHEHVALDDMQIRQIRKGSKELLLQAIEKLTRRNRRWRDELKRRSSSS